MIKITPVKDGYQIAVPSFTHSQAYTVTIPTRSQLWREQATCTCPHWHRTRRPCKHIVRAVEDLCAATPQVVFVRWDGTYGRRAHDPAYLTHDRHSWAYISVARYLLHPDEFRPLDSPPSLEEIATGLILEYEDYGCRAVARIRDGIAYAHDDSVITTRADLVNRPEWAATEGGWSNVINRELDKLLGV